MPGVYLGVKRNSEEMLVVFTVIYGRETWGMSIQWLNKLDNIEINSLESIYDENGCER